MAPVSRISVLVANQGFYFEFLTVRRALAGAPLKAVNSNAAKIIKWAIAVIEPIPYIPQRLFRLKLMGQLAKTG